MDGTSDGQATDRRTDAADRQRLVLSHDDIRCRVRLLRPFREGARSPPSSHPRAVGLRRWCLGRLTLGLAAGTSGLEASLGPWLRPTDRALRNRAISNQTKYSKCHRWVF